MIVPVYNGKKYIDRFIECLFRQSDKEFKVIFIDDCSTDGSYEKLQKYAEQDSRYTVFHNSVQSGDAATRQLGYQAADSEYLVYADIDDVLFPEYFQKLYEHLKKSKPDVIIFPHIREEWDGRLTLQERDNWKEIIDGKDWSDDDKLRFLLFRLIPACWNKCCRLSYLRQNDINWAVEIHSHSDNCYHLQVIWYAKSIEYLDCPIYRYQYNSNSLDRKPNPLDIDSIKSIFWRQRFVESTVPHFRADMFYQRWRHINYICAKNRNKTAIHRFIRALFYNSEGGSVVTVEMWKMLAEELPPLWKEVISPYSQHNLSLILFAAELLNHESLKGLSSEELEIIRNRLNHIGGFRPFKTDAAEVSAVQNTCSDEYLIVSGTPDISELSDKPSSVNPQNGINENVIREVEWRIV